MGATNQTTNYELPIFIGSDKPSWQGDFNGAMSKLDLALKTIDDKTGTNAGAIALLEGAISDLQNSVRIVEDYYETTVYTSTTQGSRQLTTTWHIVKYSDGTAECHGRTNLISFTEQNPPYKSSWSPYGTIMQVGRSQYPENLFVSKPNLMYSFEGSGCPMYMIQDAGETGSFRTGQFALVMAAITDTTQTPTTFSVQLELFARGFWREDNT